MVILVQVCGGLDVEARQLLEYVARNLQVTFENIKDHDLLLSPVFKTSYPIHPSFWQLVVVVYDDSCQIQTSPDTSPQSILSRVCYSDNHAWIVFVGTLEEYPTLGMMSLCTLRSHFNAFFTNTFSDILYCLFTYCRSLRSSLHAFTNL